MTLSLREIAFASSDYDAEIDLRYRVLREPLGLQFTDEERERDRTALHLGAFIGERLVGCLLLVAQSPETTRMRQVAIEPSMQGKGVGRRLVEFSEIQALKNGHVEIQLNARETAVPFYVSCGYETVGERFLEVGLPHLRMKKRLT